MKHLHFISIFTTILSNQSNNRKKDFEYCFLISFLFFSILRRNLILCSYLRSCLKNFSMQFLHLEMCLQFSFLPKDDIFLKYYQFLHFHYKQFSSQMLSFHFQLFLVNVFIIDFSQFFATLSQLIEIQSFQEKKQTKPMINVIFSQGINYVKKSLYFY